MERSIENIIIILTILVTLSVSTVKAQTIGMVLDTTDNSPMVGGGSSLY